MADLASGCFAVKSVNVHSDMILNFKLILKTKLHFLESIKKKSLRNFLRL